MLAPPSLRTLAFAAVAASGAASGAAAVAAQSTDHYVDGVNGSNATGNGTLAAPWKTITHAVNATSGFRRIRAAAGEYSTANGEVFPIALPPEAYISGAGRGRTFLRGTSGQIVLLPANAAGGLPVYHPLLESLTLIGPATGVLVNNPCNELGVVDVEFSGNLNGVYVNEEGDESTLNVYRSHFHHCATAVRMLGFGHGAVLLEDSRIESGTLGIEIAALWNTPEQTEILEAYLRRCRVTGNAKAFQIGHGGFQSTRLWMQSSLVAGNTMLGSCASGGASLGGSSNHLEWFWSTIADNGTFVSAHAVSTSMLTLWGSIAWNNGASIDPDLDIDAWKSNTNLPISGPLVTSVDPQFDPLAPGEYRLGAGSPLIDAHPAYGYPQPTTDFEGDPRTLDFGADGGNVVDVGWDERTSSLLLASGPAMLGTTVDLTTHATGPIPVAAFLSPATASLQIDAGNYVLIQLAPAVFLGAGIAPSTKSVGVPADPALSGLRVWAQSGGLSGAQILTSNRIEFALF